MRRIMFRAKSADDGEWVYGAYCRRETIDRNPDYTTQWTVEHYIVRDHYDEDGWPWAVEWIKVVPATVGEFTGCSDKNGVNIYEGDIVRKRTYLGMRPMKVVFSNGCFHCGWGGGSSTAEHPYLLDSNVTVLGNIYDNPELFEENK